MRWEAGKRQPNYPKIPSLCPDPNSLHNLELFFFFTVLSSKILNNYLSLSHKFTVFILLLIVCYVKIVPFGELDFLVVVSFLNCYVSIHTYLLPLEDECMSIIEDSLLYG